MLEAFASQPVDKRTLLVCTGSLLTMLDNVSELLSTRLDDNEEYDKFRQSKMNMFTITVWDWVDELAYLCANPNNSLSSTLVSAYHRKKELKRIMEGYCRAQNEKGIEKANEMCKSDFHEITKEPLPQT
jgi:hypothetical protein